MKNKIIHTFWNDSIAEDNRLLTIIWTLARLGVDLLSIFVVFLTVCVAKTSEYIFFYFVGGHIFMVEMLSPPKFNVKVSYSILFMFNVSVKDKIGIT